MPVWPTDRIREAVGRALNACGGRKITNFRDGNTVGDFFVGVTKLSASQKGWITRRIKENCELDEFCWSGELTVTVGELIDKVHEFQR